MALFDFTSLFASENAARIIERKGKRILLCVAGDSLLEVHVLVAGFISGGQWVLLPLPPPLGLICSLRNWFSLHLIGSCPPPPPKNFGIWRLPPLEQNPEINTACSDNLGSTEHVRLINPSLHTSFHVEGELRIHVHVHYMLCAN